MFNLRCIACAALVAIPAAARAQMPRMPGQGYGAQPSYWVGLSYGYQDGTTVNDGDTGTQWSFGYTSQIRATLEKTLERGASIGVSAGFATAPLTYRALPNGGACGLSCNAKADVTQWMAFLHGGSRGVGLHGEYNLEGGFTEFSNFRETTTGNALPPTRAKYDFSFGFGGGLGYQFSPMADLYVGEMFDFVLHPQDANATTSSAPRIMTFRLGFRVGF